MHVKNITFILHSNIDLGRHGVATIKRVFRAQSIVIIRPDTTPSIARNLKISIDLAKKVFQIHRVDAQGKVVLRKQLRRSEMVKYFAILKPYLIGTEA